MHPDLNIVAWMHYLICRPVSQQCAAVNRRTAIKKYLVTSNFKLHSFEAQDGHLVMLSQNMKLEIAPPLPGVVTQSTFVHFTLLVVDHVLSLY